MLSFPCLGGSTDKITHNLEKAFPVGMSLTIKVARVLATSNEMYLPRLISAATSKPSAFNL
jgi:hypothetical protein